MWVVLRENASSDRTSQAGTCTHGASASTSGKNATRLVSTLTLPRGSGPEPAAAPGRTCASSGGSWDGTLVRPLLRIGSLNETERPAGFVGLGLGPIRWARHCRGVLSPVAAASFPRPCASALHPTGPGCCDPPPPIPPRGPCAPPGAGGKCGALAPLPPARRSPHPQNTKRFHRAPPGECVTCVLRFRTASA